MPKELRFSKLVQTAGKPETVTLWTKPKDNPSFMKAVNENRIVTVFQKPSGTKKDFGTIGFHQEKFAIYLIFPKPLPQLEDAHIIGIKYELLQEQMENRPLKKKVESKKPIQKDSSQDGSHPARDGVSKFKPESESAKDYQVKIVRTGMLETTLTVNAETISQAEAKALAAVKVQNFEPDNVHDEVKSITQT